VNFEALGPANGLRPIHPPKARRRSLRPARVTDPVTERMGDADMAQEHLGEGAHLGGDVEVGVEPGVGEAQVDLGPAQDQPEAALVGPADAGTPAAG
jgi:hypothetical protein